MPIRSTTWPRVRAWIALRLARTRRTPKQGGVVVEHVGRNCLLSRAHRVDDRLHGPAQTWWPNGTKRSHGSHKDGLRDGDWFEFLPDGTLDRARTGLYREGLRIGGIRGFNEWLGSP